MKRITKKMFTIMLVIAMTVTIIPAQQTQAASWKKVYQRPLKSNLIKHIYVPVWSLK